MTQIEIDALAAAISQQSSSPHWTVFASLAIAALVAYFAYHQLKLAYLQLKNAADVASLELKSIATQISDAREEMENDHERSRRERTVETLKYFQEATRPEHNKMVKLLDLMPEEQLIGLRDAKVITLAGELKELACTALRSSFPNIYDEYCADKAAVTFSHGQSLQLRYIMLDVLNHYEVCLVPWRLGIVDIAEFEEQFRALVDQRDGKFKLETARRIIGSEKFPATEAFREHLFPPSVPSHPKKPLAS